MGYLPVLLRVHWQVLLRWMVLSSAIIKHKSQVSLGSLKYCLKCMSFLVSFNTYMSTGTQSRKVLVLVSTCVPTGVAKNQSYHGRSVHIHAVELSMTCIQC